MIFFCPMRSTCPAHPNLLDLINVIIFGGGRDSAVCIATSYGLDGPGIESRWRRDFPHPSRPALGPTQPPINGYRVFPGVKRPRRGVDHPPHLAQRLKKAYSYASTLPLDLYGLLQGEIILLLWRYKFEVDMKGGLFPFTSCSETL